LRSGGGGGEVAAAAPPAVMAALVPGAAAARFGCDSAAGSGGTGSGCDSGAGSGVATTTGLPPPDRAPSGNPFSRGTIICVLSQLQAFLSKIGSPWQRAGNPDQIPKDGSQNFEGRLEPLGPQFHEMR